MKSKASGEVLAVHAETGDVVEAGSLLVEIDKRTPRNSLSETEAALTAAQARRQIAQTQMERAASLFKSQTLTQADVEQTQLEFANAESQVVSTRVAVENARITLEDTDVRAPITGTIIEKTVEPGTVIASTTQNVSGGTTLMKMADLTTVQVRTRVDETDIGKIQPGMRTRVTVAAYPNQPFDGEVLKIEPQAIVEQNVTQFSVLIKIANRGGLLKPGMNAEVEIQIANREGVCGRADGRAARRYRRAADGGHARARRERRCARRSGPNGAPARRGAEERACRSAAGRSSCRPASTPRKVTALMQKRQSGQELTAEERTLMRTVFQQAGGTFGGGGGFRRRRWRRRRRRSSRAGGRRSAAAGFRAAASSSAAPPQTGAPRLRASPIICSAATTGSSRCAATRPVPVAVQDRPHGSRVQRDRLGPRARRSRAALAEHEPLRAAGALAGIHQPALRLDDAVPASRSSNSRTFRRFFR